MNELTPAPQKAFLLLSEPTVFHASDAALKELGWEVAEEFDAFRGVDAIVMDSFYLKAGAADFVKIKNNNIRTILILQEKETSEFQWLLSTNIDETLVLEPFQVPEELSFSIARWFKKKESDSFAQLGSPEFGSGLWVSLMASLGASG